MDRSPTDLDAAKADDETSQQRKAKLREREVSDFKWLMQDARGRRFVWRLMRESHVFTDSGSLDAIELARQSGERRSGLRVLNEILTLCPEHWMTMVNDQRLNDARS